MPENGRILADFQGQRAYPRASPNVAITFETVLILANTDYGHTPAGPRDAGPTLPYTSSVQESLDFCHV